MSANENIETAADLRGKAVVEMLERTSRKACARAHPAKKPKGRPG